MTAIARLIEKHREILEAGNPYAYFEIAYTKATGWMAWICSKPREDDPQRTIFFRGQGDSAEEACERALAGNA